MYNNNETPIICDKKIDDIIRRNRYKKDGKIVNVLYYNNGLVSESIDGAVIKRRVINKEEKQTIKLEYEEGSEIRRLIEADNDIEEARKKAMEVRMAIESLY